MATFYFDSLLGSDSNNGTTPATPWASYQAKFGANVFAGDTCFFNRGATQVITSSFFGMRGGTTAATPSKWRAYGPYGPRPRFIYGGTPWGYIFNGANVSNYDIEDIDFDGLDANSSIYIAAQGTTSVSGWKFRRSAFHNAGVSRSGLNFLKESTATSGAAAGLDIAYCDFYGNGQHGLISIATSGVRVRRSKAWGNGYNAGTGGGHGFSSRWNRNDVTSGWSLVSGTCYKRTLSAAEQAGTILYVQTSIPNHGRLSLNAGSPTAPGAYSFGVSAGELYTDILTNPNGQTIRYAFHRCYDILYEDCEAFGNLVSALSEFQEGNGFAFDDFTDSSTMRRCKSYQNQGRGLSFNRGDNNIVEDCAAWGNGLTGISSNTSNNLTIRRSTSAFNGVGNQLTAPNGSEMYFSPQVVAAISQSVIAAQPTAALAIYDDNFSTITIDRSSISGGVAVSNNITPTNVVTGAPKLTAQGAPMAGSPLLGAGVHAAYTRDVNGVQRRRPPAIGAYDMAKRINYPALA